MSNKPKILLIGSDAVGLSTLHRLRMIHPDLDVQVVEEHQGVVGLSHNENFLIKDTILPIEELFYINVDTGKLPRSRTQRRKKERNRKKKRK